MSQTTRLVCKLGERVGVVIKESFPTKMHLENILKLVNQNRCQGFLKVKAKVLNLKVFLRELKANYISF